MIIVFSVIYILEADTNKVLTRSTLMCETPPVVVLMAVEPLKITPINRMTQKVSAKVKNWDC